MELTSYLTYLLSSSTNSTYCFFYVSLTLEKWEKAVPILVGQRTLAVRRMSIITGRHIMDLVSETIATVLYSYKGSIYPMDASF